jgi:hypothetical protein
MVKFAQSAEFVCTADVTIIAHVTRAMNVLAEGLVVWIFMH